jgi:hypothetical protein
METTAPPAAYQVTDESGAHALVSPAARGGQRIPVHASAPRRSN